MPDMIEILGSNGKCESVSVPEIYVLSNEIIPAGMKRGTRVFIIDKVAAAFCDGNDTWYMKDGTPATAGQPWSAMF